MQYQINHLSSVEKELSVSIPATEVNENIEKTYKRISKTANIKGFRPGKVPLNVVKQIYGKSVLADVEQHFVSNALEEAAVKEKLHIINTPVLEKKTELKENGEYVFTLKFEVFPQVVVNNRKFEAEYTPIVYKNEFLEEELAALKRRLTEFNPVERPAKDKDRVRINFEGRMNGTLVDGTSGSDVPVVIGAGGFIEDFEQALKGKTAGEKFTTPVKFPENYHSKDLAGKTLDFSIEVISVEEGIEPEITEELLKEKNIFDGSVEEFKSDLESRIKKYIEGINNDNKRYIALDKVVTNNEVEVPKSFLNAEIKVREEDYKKRNKVSEISEEERKKIEEDALWVSKRFLILSQLAKDFQISVSEAELDESLAVDAAKYNVTVDILKRVLDKDRLNERRMSIQENKVIDKIMQEITFIEKEPKE